jgi:hypothetical protein
VTASKPRACAGVRSASAENEYVAMSMSTMFFSLLHWQGNSAIGQIQGPRTKNCHLVLGAGRGGDWEQAVFG